VRHAGEGNDARECLPALLPLHGLRRHAEAPGGRLLRVLLVRGHGLSTQASRVSTVWTAVLGRNRARGCAPRIRQMRVSRCRGAGRRMMGAIVGDSARAAGWGRPLRRLARVPDGAGRRESHSRHRSQRLDVFMEPPPIAMGVDWPARKTAISLTQGARVAACAIDALLVIVCWPLASV